MAHPRKLANTNFKLNIIIVFNENYSYCYGFVYTSIGITGSWILTFLRHTFRISKFSNFSPTVWVIRYIWYVTQTLRWYKFMSFDILLCFTSTRKFFVRQLCMKVTIRFWKKLMYDKWCCQILKFLKINPKNSWNSHMAYVSLTENFGKFDWLKVFIDLQWTISRYS